MNTQHTYTQEPTNTETTSYDFFENFITWFLVTRPVQEGNKLYRGIPVSANFRTKSEAECWLSKCGLDDAYILCHSIICNLEDREATEASIFNGECPAMSICYKIENLQA